MPERPTLLFLHGVGEGDQEDGWKDVLEQALREAGHPGLDGVSVIAPKYAHALRGVDDDTPLPDLTVKTPTGEIAKSNRRKFERRQCAVEVMLGAHDRGAAWFGGDPIAGVALRQPKFRQAANYLNKNRVRAQVLTMILRRLPPSGRLVIVGHSLGSVIAADLIRRLPADVEVAGMVTIGSPLSSGLFHVEGLRDTLREPPTNLAWWVNFWHPADPVTTHRGVSSVFPWVTDYRVRARVDRRVHDATTYLAAEPVAQAVGYALYGSTSREMVVSTQGVDVPVDTPETLMLLALRYAFLVQTKLEGERFARYAAARRYVQGTTAVSMAERREREGRPLPHDVARLVVDLGDPVSKTPEPARLSHISKEDAVLPLVSIMTTNVIHPFEISVPTKLRVEALEDLAVEMGLGRQFARDLVAAGEASRKALAGDGTNWIKWAAIGLGAVSLVVATGGLALAAAPGVAGAAAITSALAAFGPGGMIGGLLTAGALVGAGGGGVAVGLASPATSAVAVEAYVATQLTAAILRREQGLERESTTWENLAETGIEVRRDRARLEPVSDEGAPTLKELKLKLRAIDRALNYLSKIGWAPDPEDATHSRLPSDELMDRAQEAFRSVDGNANGTGSEIVERPSDRSEVVRKAALKGAVGSLLRRRRADDTTAGRDASPSDEKTTPTAD